jgi:Resolvase, N terminal domain
MVRTKAPGRQVVRSAAIYARIAADLEGKSLGVQRQLEDCRKLAADRGWPVGAEYVDNDVSAFSGKPRQQYARMLADLGSEARDAVIVYNLTVDHTPAAWAAVQAGKRLTLRDFENGLLSVLCHRCNVEAGHARGSNVSHAGWSDR